MSKRNFILLIIVLVIATTAIFGFLYFKKDSTPAEGEEESTGTNFISQFNPFESKKEPTETVTPSVEVSGYQPPIEDIQKKLNKVSTMPIAGFITFSKERLKEIPVATAEQGESLLTTPTTKLKKPATEFALALRYVDKATGNIYQTFVDKIEEKKFSTTIIPKVHEAFFGNKGESVVMRYLKEDERTIETFVGTLPKELFGVDTKEDNEIKGAFLPNNIKDASMSPDGSKIFYLFNNGDSVAGAILSFLNNKKVQIFDSPFTEWLSFWPIKNMITLTTKPSANVPGYMYSINETGKNLTKVLGDINGLTTLGSPNGKLILYSDNNLSLNIYHMDSRNSNLLGIKTMSEKCVWGKASDVIYCAAPKSISAGEYPDVWYQGEVSFSDQLWKIDVKTGNATIILDPATTEGGKEIDGIKLALEESENYLFFVNKKDSFLWKLELR